MGVQAISGEAILGEEYGVFRGGESGEGDSGEVVSNDISGLGIRVRSESRVSAEGVFCGKNVVNRSSWPGGVSHISHTRDGILKSGSVSKIDGIAVSTLFVGNIPPSMVPSRLKNRFLSYGSVVDVFISQIRSRVDGTSFEFVQFSIMANAICACEALNAILCDGFRLQINVSRYARSKSLSNSGQEEQVIGNVMPMDVSHPIRNSNMGFGMLSGCGSYAQVVKSVVNAMEVQQCTNKSFVEKDAGNLEVIVSNKYENSFVLDQDAAFKSGFVHPCEPSLTKLLGCESLDYIVKSSGQINSVSDFSAANMCGCSIILNKKWSPQINMCLIRPGCPRPFEGPIGNVLSVSELCVSSFLSNEVMDGGSSCLVYQAHGSGNVSSSEWADPIAADLCFRGFEVGYCAGHVISCPVVLEDCWTAGDGGDVPLSSGENLSTPFIAKVSHAVVVDGGVYELTSVSSIGVAGSSSHEVSVVGSASSFSVISCRIAEERADGVVLRCVAGIFFHGGYVEFQIWRKILLCWML